MKNIGELYSYGPRYIEFNQLGKHDKTLDLKIGEYNLVFDKRSSDSDIKLKYSLSLNHPQHSHSPYVD